MAPECIDEAQVALSEACSNLIRHADHTFEVAMNIGEAELTVDVLYAEAGFPTQRRLTRWPDIAVEPDHGLALMTAFADHASLESAGAGGSVRLRKTLRWASERPPQPTG